ncbi:MAG: ParA family protein [Myxococcaceae bacterium]
MAKIIALFNNKGGVGKTTFLFHVAHLLADTGVNVLMVDCDSQCNLTAYTLDENAIEKAWDEGGNSIYRAIEPVARTIGDIRNRAPTVVEERLHLLPGDLLLSEFEDLLGDTWTAAKGGGEPALRAQSAIHRVIQQAAEKAAAGVVLVDLGPNLGALNRAVLAGSDYIIVPVSPDLFSIRGTENLGGKLVKWRKEWDQANGAWAGKGLDIPKGRPKFLGFVTQHHNVRDNAAGMTRGWQIFGSRLLSAIRTNIVDRLEPLGQLAGDATSNYDLGKIPNLHSLIPYSQEARKPVFNCAGSDGLVGAHIKRARESRDHFAPLAAAIRAAIQ